MESYRYSYDKNSNITEKTEVNNYPKEEKDKVNETKAYTYDALGRLTKTVTTDQVLGCLAVLSIGCEETTPS